MRILTLTLAAFAMTAPVAAQAQRSDNVIDVSSNDAAMNAAIGKARQQLPDFFAHLAKPQIGEHSFSVKFDLLPEPGKAEYIWAEVISRSGGVTTARLANNPVDARFKLGDTVKVRDEDIVDWGYFRSGVMQGHFTTRALLPGIDPAQAEGIRKALGWK